jgi:hypothetical protein
MEVLQYQLSGRYVIKASTTDTYTPWMKFKARVDNYDSYCNYSTNTDGVLSLFDNNKRRMELLPKEKWSAACPVFYETNNYSFSIHFFNVKNGTRPHIIHADKRVQDMFNYEITGSEALLIGAISFLNEPGRFCLRFSYVSQDGIEHKDELSFDVVSPKLDTKHDLKVIIQEIKAEYDDLVFRYLTLTFQQFEQGGEANNDIIWLSIFKGIIHGYIDAVRYILHRPHIRYIRTEEFSRAERIKRWDNRLAERFINDRIADEDKALRNYYQYSQTESTEDTRENRFVKYTLERIAERLDRVVGRIRFSTNGNVSAEEINSLVDYHKELKKMQNSSLFRTVGRFDGFRQESIVLQQRTGYAQVYRYWIMLQNGLNLIEGNTAVGVLPVWKLYEVWCFLKMKRLVCDVLGLNPRCKEDLQYIHENRQSMTNPFSDSEMEDTVKFDNLENGDEIELGYQYSYSRTEERDSVHSLTVKQKPDIVMNVHKANTGFVLTYLFDAKYRVMGDDDPIANTSIEDRPVEDTLNQMHRYRDAIYYGNREHNNFAKEVIGAYILFPGRMDEKKNAEYISEGKYKQLPYYLSSIFEVNIGAFPLLPNENSGILLKNHLETIIKGQTVLEQITNSVPQKGLYYTDTKPKEKLVFIGVVKNDNQFIEDFKSNTASIYYTGETVSPSLDVQSVGYFMPIVKGYVQGVYKISAIKPARKSEMKVHSSNPSDGIRLFFILDEFISFGDEKIKNDNHLHNGDITTLDGGRKIYSLLKEENWKEINTILSTK